MKKTKSMLLIFGRIHGGQQQIKYYAPDVSAANLGTNPQILLNHSWMYCQ